jgi:hypothetical protein
MDQAAAPTDAPPRRFLVAHEQQDVDAVIANASIESRPAPAASNGRQAGEPCRVLQP